MSDDYENDYGFNWRQDCTPMLEKAKENFKAGRYEWIEVKQGVASYFLEVLPPLDWHGKTFAVGEAYDSDPVTGENVYLCFYGLSRIGIREDPVNAVVAVLRAIPDPDTMAKACYMTRRQLRDFVTGRGLPKPKPQPVKATV